MSFDKVQVGVVDVNEIVAREFDESRTMVSSAAQETVVYQENGDSLSSAGIPGPACPFQRFKRSTS